jgi:ferredoxin
MPHCVRGQTCRLPAPVLADGDRASLRLHPGGALNAAARRIEAFEMNQDDSILDAALRQGADLPFACKGGVCATCKCKVLRCHPPRVKVDNYVAAGGQRLAAQYITRRQLIRFEASWMPHCVRGQTCRLPARAGCAPPVNAKCCAAKAIVGGHRHFAAQHFAFTGGAHPALAGKRQVCPLTQCGIQDGRQL